MIYAGERDGYRWIQSAQLELSQLLRLCPEIVVNRFVAVTAFDSGSLQLSENEALAGWTMQGSVTYSPRIEREGEVPWAEYDEWYIFAEPMHIQVAEVFVNRSGFGVYRPAKTPYIGAAATTQDLGGLEDENSTEAMLARFWADLRAANPESYLAYGDNLVFVTKNLDLYNRVLRGIRTQDEIEVVG